MVLLAAAVGGAAQEQHVTVGFADYPPLGHVRPDGSPGGFAIELLQEAARREGIPLKWALVRGTAESALESGQIELWPGGANMPGRWRSFHVSSPWWTSGLQLVVPDESAVRDPAELAGKPVAVGRSIETLARQWLSMPALLVRRSHADAVAALCEGAAEAAFIDYTALERVLLQRPPACTSTDLRTISLPGARMELSIVGHPSRRRVVERLRRRLDDLAIDGTLAAIAARYPPSSAVAAENIATVLRARYERNLLGFGLASACLLLLVSGWSIRRLRRDVSARKAAEHALARERQLLRSIIDAIPVMITIYDPALKSFQINREIERVLGWSAEDAARSDFMEKCYPDPKYRDTVRGFMQALEPGWCDFNVTAKDGGVVESSWANIRLSDDTQVGIGIDIRQRLRAEQALRQQEERLREAQKMESIGVLAGGIAHDFNNLLTAILGNASLLQMDAPAGDGQHLGAILESAEKAAALTRQLLAYAGKGQFQVTDFDVSRLVRSLADLLRVSIPKNVEIDLDVPKNLPAVRGDSSQIQQVVMNLVINAAEATKGRGGGRVSISAGMRDLDAAAAGRTGSGITPGQYVWVGVSDNGCGMDEQTISRIFDPFFTTKFTGRGLGLAAVHGILRSHKGAITVESSPGQGSTFTVFLPCRGEVSAASDHSQAIPVTDRRATVLVVDDEEPVRAFTKAALERLGHTVLLANNGRQALDLLAGRDDVELVLLDVIMPVVDGVEAYAEMRRRRPDLPVLICSGYSRQEASRLGLPGDLPFIQKPYTMPVLAAAIEKVRTANPGAP